MTISTSAPVHRPHKITGSRLTGTCRAARARAGRVTSIKWLKMWHRPLKIIGNVYDTPYVRHLERVFLQQRDKCGSGMGSGCTLNSRF